MPMSRKRTKKDADAQSGGGKITILVSRMKRANEDNDIEEEENRKGCWCLRKMRTDVGA